MSTGWTWDYCLWNLDIPRLCALNAYWRNSPPVHLMVAAYLGIKPKEGAERSPENAPEAPEHLEIFGSEPVAAPVFMSAKDYLKMKDNNVE